MFVNWLKNHLFSILEQKNPKIYISVKNLKELFLKKSSTVTINFQGQNVEFK